MIPTGADVLAEARAWLDDDGGGTFTDAVVNRGFRPAYETLFNAMLVNQLPRLKNITTFTLNPNTTSLTPLQMGIADFGEYDMLEERLQGSTDRYREVFPRDTLTQHDPSDILGEFVWRLDTFEFIGATTQRQLRLTYFASATPPDLTGTVGKNTSIGVDGSLTFLGKLTAANCGPRKGYDIDAARLKQEAVGSRFADGQIGGDLYYLLLPMIRNLQKVQVAPKPYSIYGRRRSRCGPYVAAPPGGGGGGLFTFTSAGGLVTPVADGENAVFYLSSPLTIGAQVVVNGITMTPIVMYTHGANVITFKPGYIPAAGASIIVTGWQ